MHERISRRVARLLAHPAGFLAFNAFTVAWFTVPAAAAWILGGATWALGALVACLTGYLDVVTWFSTATQFTLAFQNEAADRKLDAALAQIDTVVDQVLVAAEAILQLAKNEATMQEALVSQAHLILSLLSDQDASRVPIVTTEVWRLPYLWFKHNWPWPRRSSRKKKGGNA